MNTPQKAPTVWNKLVDNIDVSGSGGIRVAYETNGRVQYVYLNEAGINAVLGSRKSLEEACVLLSQSQMTRAISRKGDQAFNKAYKMVFDLTQNDAIARTAGDAARKTVETALETATAQDQVESNEAAS